MRQASALNRVVHVQSKRYPRPPVRYLVDVHDVKDRLEENELGCRRKFVKSQAGGWPVNVRLKVSSKIVCRGYLSL